MAVASGLSLLTLSSSTGWRIRTVVSGRIFTSDGHCGLRRRLDFHTTLQQTTGGAINSPQLARTGGTLRQTAQARCTNPTDHRGGFSVRHSPSPSPSFLPKNLALAPTIRPAPTSPQPPHSACSEAPNPCRAASPPLSLPPGVGITSHLFRPSELSPQDPSPTSRLKVAVIRQQFVCELRRMPYEVCMSQTDGSHADACHAVHTTH